MDGIDELKALAYVLGHWRDDFARKFTAEQLLVLFRVFRAGKWDICPDQWSERQVQEALAGITPEFDDNDQPVYRS